MRPSKQDGLFYILTSVPARRVAAGVLYCGAPMSVPIQLAYGATISYYRSMNARFVRFSTEDGLILQGLLYTPDRSAPKALLHIHGMSGNFYENRFLDVMAEALTGAGYAFFSINTRGHDYMADFSLVGNEEKYKRIGNTYEIFAESPMDIKPAIDWLEHEGYKEIVLCGHSLGAAKVAYYIAKTRDARVQRLVLMSPPDMVGLAEKEGYHNDVLKLAHEMVDSGKGDDRLPNKVWDWYWLSAKTYIDLFSRDSPADIFNVYDLGKPSLLADAKVPIFAFFGGKDDAAIGSPQKNLEILRSKARGAPAFDIAVIEDASHGYFGKEKEMAQAIITWLVK